MSYAAGQLGGERTLELTQALASRVEAIVTAQPDFATDARLQEQRAVAWCGATYAASALGGERALELAQALAGRVEAIVTAQPDFVAHAGLQKQRVIAWGIATSAASQLGGERALELAQALIGHVEAIITAQPDFAACAELQKQRVIAWRYVIWAAEDLGGEQGRQSAVTAAYRVRDIVFGRRWEDPRPFKNEWEQIQKMLLPFGVNLTEDGQIEFAWAPPAATPPTYKFEVVSGFGLPKQNEPKSVPSTVRSDSNHFTGDHS
ncbi:hypothetical protein H0A66_02125 [Alcaligenaceae bacterium]|nr:hypothetical protein [Alcaligenaceae bacterium]